MFEGDFCFIVVQGSSRRDRWWSHEWDETRRERCQGWMDVAKEVESRGCNDGRTGLTLNLFDSSTSSTKSVLGVWEGGSLSVLPNNEHYMLLVTWLQTTQNNCWICLLSSAVLAASSQVCHGPTGKNTRAKYAFFPPTSKCHQRLPQLQCEAFEAYSLKHWKIHYACIFLGIIHPLRNQITIMGGQVDHMMGRHFKLRESV